MRRLLLFILLLLLSACSIAELTVSTPERPTPFPTSVPTDALPGVENVLEPAPRLLDPENGISLSLSEAVKLAWVWNRPAQPGELFDVQIAKRGGVFERATLAQSSVFDATDWFLNAGPGEYQWTVRVIQLRQENNMERRISLEAEPFTLEITE